MKDDLLDTIFHSSTNFGWRLNTAHLALIPKKNEADWGNDLRPIRLTNNGHKILANVLANRMKDTPNDITGEAQGAFINGRQILEATLVASELMDNRHKQKSKGFIFKVNLEKAYDHVNGVFCYGAWTKWV